MPLASLEPMLVLLAMLPQDVRAGMVAMYADSLDTQLALLRQAIEAGDAQAMQSGAHKLAGSAAMMQDRELSMAARAMEAALRECRADAAVQAWPGILACAELTQCALRDCS